MLFIHIAVIRVLQRPRQRARGSELWAKALASVLMSARVCSWGEHTEHWTTVLGGAYGCSGTEYHEHHGVLRSRRKPFGI